MRSPTRRAKFEEQYRERSLNRVLESFGLFRDLGQEEYEKLLTICARECHLCASPLVK